MDEREAIAFLASRFDGATWCAHRTASALQDPRVLPHGHPATWRKGVTAVTLAIAMQRPRFAGLSMVGHVVVDDPRETVET